jgi:general secretion pathway protein I
VSRARTMSGFTLIEVLVALVIVAVGMAAVMSALSSSANTLNFLRDETLAQWMALNQIATIRLSGQSPPTGTTSGDTDFAGRSWHWRQEVVNTQLPGVVRIDMKVRPKEVKAGDDEAWTTTVSGIYGGSIGRGDGYNPNWGQQTSPYAANAGGLAGAAGLAGGLNSPSSASSQSSLQITPSTPATGLGSGATDSLGSGSSSASPTTSTLDSLDSGLDSSPPPSQQAPPQPQP